MNRSGYWAATKSYCVQKKKGLFERRDGKKSAHCNVIVWDRVFFIASSGAAKNGTLLLEMRYNNVSD